MAKKTLIGKIVSDKMKNTVVVLIERKIQHPVYKKFITLTKKYKADTNNLELKVGDVVSIEETRPISRGKSFKVVKKI